MSTGVLTPKEEHRCTQNLTKRINVSSPNRGPIVGAPIANGSTDVGVQRSMRHTSVPLQMWSTIFFFGQKNIGAHGSWRTGASKPVKKHRCAITRKKELVHFYDFEAH